MTTIQIADREPLDAGEYVELDLDGDHVHVVTSGKTTAVTLARPGDGEQACIVADNDGLQLKR